MISFPCVFSQGPNGFVGGTNSLTGKQVFPASVRFNPRDRKVYRCYYTDADQTRVLPADPMSLDEDEWVRDSLVVDILCLRESDKIIGRSRTRKVAFPKKGVAVPIGEWCKCRVEETERVLFILEVVGDTSRERIAAPKPKGDGGEPRGKKRKKGKGRQQEQSVPSLGTLGDLLVKAGVHEKVRSSTDGDSEAVKRFRRRHPNWKPE